MTSTPVERWLADFDLCGRIMLTHQLGPALLACAVGITNEVAAAVLAGSAVNIPYDIDRAERLTLVANILVRLEVRLAHDSRAIRLALDQLVERVDGLTFGNAMAGDLDTLRSLRHAVDEMKQPTIRWWRVGH